MEQPRHVVRGAKGFDITAYKRAANAYRAHDQTAGKNWPIIGGIHAALPSEYRQGLVESVAAIKRRKHIEERGIGPKTFAALAPYFDKWGWMLLKLSRPKCPVDPLQGKGVIIGVPYVGTHLDFHNWESDNAVDIAVPVGTPVVAVCDGTIGSQIGYLGGNNPQLLGQRLHLTRADGKQEWYYAHLSYIAVHALEKVKTGQVLGRTGSANGVAHLHFAQRHGDPGIIVGEPSPNYRDRNYGG